MSIKNLHMDAYSYFAHNFQKQPKIKLWDIQRMEFYSVQKETNF